jgi:polysaccharide export outer membrane protein
MRRIRRVRELDHRGRVAVALLSVLLAGCGSKPLNVPYNPSDFGPPDVEQVAPVPDEIGPGDKLHVTVFGVDSLSGDFQVEANGQIDFPFVGAVQAQGQTPSQFAKLLADRLGEKVLKNPNVQVAVAERAPRTITVEGAVKQAAVVPVQGNTTTLLKAIALGGGVTEDANTQQVVVFRTVKGQRMAAAFDLRAISRAEAPDPVIYPNDIVVVAGSHNKRLVDNVLRGLTVLGMFRPF